MKSYQIGADVVISLPIEDEAGSSLSPTALSYSVYDGDGEEIVSNTALALPDTSDVSIIVPASVNEKIGVREVRLKITTSDGIVHQIEYYRLISGSKIAVPENSFQTYASALLVADDLANLDDWFVKSDDDRQGALIEAFHRLKVLNFNIPAPDAVDSQSYLISAPGWILSSAMWPSMTKDLFLSYPDYFRAALSRAQVVEANEILGSNAIQKKRKDGLLSESIGESSMMFRPGARPFDYGISKEALRHLRGYVSFKFAIGRS